MRRKKERIMELVKARDSEGADILLANVNGETVSNFRLIGKIGQHADLSFRYYKDGPQEVRFPMADSWPTERQAASIVSKYVEKG